MKELSKQGKEIEKYVELAYSVAKQDLDMAIKHQNRHCGQNDLARAEGAYEALGKVLLYLEGLTYTPVKQ